MSTKLITESMLRELADEAADSDERADLLSSLAYEVREAGEVAVPIVEDLDAKLLEQVTANPKALNMNSWHGRLAASGVFPYGTLDALDLAVSQRRRTCGTAHCRAGWAVVLAGEAGRALENRFGAGGAGALIYIASTGNVPDFYISNEEALADIRKAASR